MLLVGSDSRLLRQYNAESNSKSNVGLNLHIIEYFDQKPTLDPSNRVTRMPSFMDPNSTSSSLLDKWKDRKVIVLDVNSLLSGELVLQNSARSVETRFTVVKVNPEIAFSISELYAKHVLGG